MQCSVPPLEELCDFQVKTCKHHNKKKEGGGVEQIASLQRCPSLCVCGTSCVFPPLARPSVARSEESIIRNDARTRRKSEGGGGKGEEPLKFENTLNGEKKARKEKKN